MEAAVPNAEFGRKRISAWPVFKLLFEAAPNENQLFSPLSAEVILASLLAGVTGPSESALRELLDLDQEDGEILLLQLADDLLSLRRRLSIAEFELASGFWAQFDRLQLRDDLSDLYRDALQMVLRKVDFRDNAAMREINHWVEKATHGKIARLPVPSRPPWIPIGQPYPLFLGVNALYLKAGWQYKFSPYRHGTDLFHNADGLASEAEFMELLLKEKDACITYLENEHLQAVRLPFHDEELVMEVVLPRMGISLSEIMKLEMLASPEPAEGVFRRVDRVYLLLPELLVERQVHFATGELGKRLSPLFTPGSDLDGMFVKTDEEERLSLTDVVQAVTLQVDRVGVEGSAVTVTSWALGGMAEAPEGDLVTFEADRPFLFRIRHLGNKRDLFVGTLCQVGRAETNISKADQNRRKAYRASIPLRDRLARMKPGQLRSWAAERYRKAISLAGLEGSHWANLGDTGR